MKREVSFILLNCDEQVLLLARLYGWYRDVEYESASRLEQDIAKEIF